MNTFISRIYPQLFANPALMYSTVAALLVALLMLSLQATADDPPQQIPYSGTLKKDGQPITATGAEAPWIKFELLEELEGFESDAYWGLPAMTLSGSAVRYSPDDWRDFEPVRLRLTSATNGERGEALLDQTIAWNADTSFSTKFQAHIHGGSGADGMGFFLRGTSSVMVEIDTYPNEIDPDDNHFGINLNEGLLSSVVTATPEFDIKTAGPFFVWVDYDGSTDSLKVYSSVSSVKPLTPYIDHTIDLHASLGDNVSVGFHGWTGEVNNNHDILSWRFNYTGAQRVVFAQSMPVNVYNGKFTALLGDSTTYPPEDGVQLHDIFKTADALTMRLTMLNNVHVDSAIDFAATAEDDAVLGNPQTLVMTPFAMWTRRAADFHVSGDLSYSGKARFKRNVKVDGGIQGLNLSDDDPEKGNRTAQALHALINSSLQVGGNSFSGYNVSQSYTSRAIGANYGRDWGDDKLMLATSNSFCLLQQHYTKLSNSFILEGFDVGCRIVKNSENTHWVLQSKALNGHSSAYSEARCKARCLTW